MIDFPSCLSDYAVQISDTSCSASAKHSVAPRSVALSQNAVTCLYRTLFANEKQMLITVTWCKNSVYQGVSVTFGEEQSSSFKLNTNSRLFRKLKGSKSIPLHNYEFEVFWDLTAARYQTGPEPVAGYYIFITCNSEVCLILGDTAEEAKAKRLKTEAKFSLIKRQDHFLGDTHYSTKVKFCETGAVHDILIRCRGEEEGLKHPELCVHIDHRMVIRVQRLQWNFRGNQTIFLDGLLVDFLWDVHDWFYAPSSGCAVFMFRTRSGLDCRLWLEEKTDQKYQDKPEFTLMIYACKNTV